MFSIYTCSHDNARSHTVLKQQQHYQTIKSSVFCASQIMIFCGYVYIYIYYYKTRYVWILIR